LAGPALVLLAAALATAPIVLHGGYCGDDLEFHAVSWFDVQQSWLHGTFYPHWMPSANYGAGEPRFLFYPPLTWMVGAALGLVLPWSWVPVAMVFLLLAGTGLAVRALALEALEDAPATLAGCAALFSGFALFTAYERAAFAEMSGGFWIPLLLLFALRDRSPDGGLWRRAMDGSALPAALLLAGCWLADGPVGVMASYLLAAVALTASVLRRSWAPLLRGSVAAVLGIGLTAFYLIPAAREQSWIDLKAAIDLPVFNVENNWIFSQHADPRLAPYAMVLERASVLAASMIGVALAGWLVAWRRKALPSNRGWWIPLAVIPAVALFLQFPASLPVWNLLPKMRFLQYPWRWNLVVEAPMGILFAAAVWPGRRARRWQRAAVAAVCALAFVAATAFAAKTFLRTADEGDTVADLLAQYQDGGGLEGTDEYEPEGADHWKIATRLPDACFSDDWNTALGVTDPGETIPHWHAEQGSCEAAASARIRTPEHVRVAMVAPHEGYLILRLLSYPAWRITVNGRVTEPADLRDDGLIAVPVEKGRVELAVDWTTTPDVMAGRAVSGLALALLIGLGWLERKTASLSKQHGGGGAENS